MVHALWQSKRIATIALSAIGAVDYLDGGTILMRVMFCSMVAVKKILMFFPARKSVNDRREVVRHTPALCHLGPYSQQIFR